MNINEDPLFNNSVDDMVEFKNPTQQSIEQRNDFTLGKDRQYTPGERDHNMTGIVGDSDKDSQSKSQRVQFSSEFNKAFEQFQSNVNVDLVEKQPSKYETDDQSKEKDKSSIKDDVRDKQIQAEINELRKGCEGDNNTIEYLTKLWKRRNGSTKMILSKREEFFQKKYRRSIAELLNPDSKYFFQRFIRPESEQYSKKKSSKVIQIDSTKLKQKDGEELREEESKLMLQLGVPQEKIDERLKKHIKQSIAAKLTKGAQHLVQQQQQQQSDFTEKTSNFIQLIFENYAIKEFIVPGTENATIYEVIRFVEQLNQYVSQLSEFMTTKTVYLANDKQKMVNEDDAFNKQLEKRKKYQRKGNESERSDTNIEGDPAYEVFEDDKTQAQLENFQNILEMKYIEMLGNQNHEEANFYQSLLQKLNAIDLLQLYLKQCARKIKSGERLLTFKKELSFGMLQIFREEISKKMLTPLVSSNREAKVDYDMIDKTVRKLRFFKNFAQSIRMQLYQVARYELIPPNRVIAHQEEFDSHIFVIISGIASLTVKYLETNEAYSGMLIYPGDAIGDANIKDKIVISKGRGEAKTYISSVKECDVLVFERKVFSDVLFKDMMDSLYEKIIAMRSSEFFENLSPYAMVILCSNVELHEYSYGDVILRQETEPLECFIIISGECKLVLETVIYKEKVEETANTGVVGGNMKFGKNIYNPSEIYGKKIDSSKQRQLKQEVADKKERLINQRKLNEKFSFQHEKLDFPNEFDDKDRSSSPVLRAPVINETESPMFSEQKQGKKMIPYRHHLFYDKVVQGKVLCSRALLEKEYAMKFIHKKYDHFKEQLNVEQPPLHSKQNTPASRFNTTAKKGKNAKNGNQLQEEHTPLLDEEELAMVERGLNFNSPQKKSQVHHDHNNFTEDSRDSRQLEIEREQEVDQMYQTLMKSQLTVIADQACVKVLKLTRKSKKYLSDPLKTMIDNRIFDTKFKDYDRPFKNELEVNKFVNGQRQWEQYKEKLSKKITTAKFQNQLFK